MSLIQEYPSMKIRFDYYQSIRHTQPDLFYTPKLQHQMRQEQKLMGNAFFDQYEMSFLEVTK